MSAKRKILIDEQQNQARCADGVKMNKTKLKQETVTASLIKSNWRVVAVAAYGKRSKTNGSTC